MRRLDLKAEMVKRGLSITEVADGIGITRVHLSNVLNGQSRMTDRLAVQFAHVTGIPLEVVRGEEPAHA